jgi:uncharacterized protein (DUF1810 family)
MVPAPDLERFVEAQNPVYSDVREELLAGTKRSHWMWFIFPQLEGLGHSPMARKFGISSIQEAQAYLQHPVLGPRLRECTRLVLAHENRTAHDIFGSPDDLKFRSCMTLFSRAEPGATLFLEALDKYFAGKPDSLTLAGLGIGK